MEVARLMADLEKKPRTDCELIFAHRYDFVGPGNTARSHCEKKFTVSSYQTHTRWFGWPAGPNGMARDCLLEAARRLEQNSGYWWSPEDMVLLLEPDACPITPDWLDQIYADWLVARAQAKIIMGSWRNSGGQYGHINGNCCVIPAFATIIDVKQWINQDVAWDCTLVPFLKDRWHVSGLFKNAFQTAHMTEEEMVKPEVGIRKPALIHGVKDSSVLDHARKQIPA